MIVLVRFPPGFVPLPPFLLPLLHRCLVRKHLRFFSSFSPLLTKWIMNKNPIKVIYVIDYLLVSLFSRGSIHDIDWCHHIVTSLSLRSVLVRVNLWLYFPVFFFPIFLFMVLSLLLIWWFRLLLLFILILNSDLLVVLSFVLDLSPIGLILLLVSLLHLLIDWFLLLIWHFYILRI